MGIYERDIKALRQTSSATSRIVSCSVLSLMIILLLVLAMLNFRLSYQFGSLVGLTISDVFQKWLEGLSTSGVYSGKLLLAIQRLQTALTQIALAVIFGLVLWIRESTSKRNARILKFIEERKT